VNSVTVVALDGKQVIYSSSAGKLLPDFHLRIWDGTGFRRFSRLNSIGHRTKRTNPKNRKRDRFLIRCVLAGTVYSMNRDGARGGLSGRHGRGWQRDWHPAGQITRVLPVPGIREQACTLFTMEVARRG